MCDSEGNQVIFLLDDEVDVVKTLSEILRTKLPECTVYAFTDVNEFINHPSVYEADLYIMDIKLADGEDGRKVCARIHEEIVIHVPCLFISAWTFDEKAFDMLGNKCVFDFILKPFNMQMFTNRVSVLLKHSKMFKDLYIKEQDTKAGLQKAIDQKGVLLKKVESAMWEQFNYSSLYTVILDGDMKIKLGNFALAKALGYDTEDELIGLDWMNFVGDNEQKVVRYSLEKMYEKDLDYRECSHDIKGVDGETISVKWFNSYINDKFHGIFSIGVPLTREITTEDNIDSLRAYYKDIVERDRTMIQSVKEVALNKKREIDFQLEIGKEA